MISMKKRNQIRFSFVFDFKNYRQISKKYHVSTKTIAKFKSKDNWKRKTYNQDVLNMSINKHSKINQKWKRFCLLYSRGLNATKAYMKVYHCSKSCGRRSASRLLTEVNIKCYLSALKHNNVEYFYIKQAEMWHANIKDYVNIHTTSTKKLDANGKPILDVYGKSIINHETHISLKTNPYLDWSLVKTYYQDKRGCSVLMYDIGDFSLLD